MAKNQRPIDLLTKAHQKKLIYVKFEIPIDDNSYIDAIMNAPDMYSIFEEQEKVYQLKYAECKSEGLSQFPINEDEWEKELDSLGDPETRERMAEDKPKNLAEQIAKKVSKLRTVQELIPKFLKGKDGNPLFPTKDEQQAFKEIICSDMALMNLLTKKYLELVTQVTEVTKEAKNSQEQANLESGESRKPAPDDGAVTEDLLPEN